MILKRVIVNGKEVYEPISFEDALVFEDKNSLVFTSEDEKDEFDEHLESSEEIAERFEELSDMLADIENQIEGLEDLDVSQKYKDLYNDLKSRFNELNDNQAEDIEVQLDLLEDKIEDLEDELDDMDTNSGSSISINGKYFSFDKNYGEIIEKSFGNVFNGSNNSKTNSLMMALPFMDKDYLHELVENIVNESENYKDLNLVAVMPFLRTEDCDNLFMKFVLEGKSCKYSIVSLAPFVSKKCLSGLIDEYVKGNFQDVEMNALYPFLDSEDVKRVFNYILTKRDS